MNKLFTLTNKDKIALLGLCVFLGFPFLLQLLDLGLVLAELGMWLLLLSIILWIYFVEKRTVSSIGWKKMTVKTIFVAIGFGLVLFVLFGIFTIAIQAIGFELNQETAKLYASQSMPFLILVVLRAGVVEEVLYRAYAYERINELIKSQFIAGLVPLIIFMLVHLSWGVGHMLFIFFGGGLLVTVYAVKRNLALNIIAHITVDIIVLFVLPMMLES